MKRILFVDDDPEFLQGLQEMLLDMQEDWQMDFVSDGKTAWAKVVAFRLSLLSHSTAGCQDWSLPL